MATLKPASCLIAATTFALAQGAGAVGLPDVPSNTHTGKQLEGTTDFLQALKGGSPDLWLRLRYENVSDDIPGGSPLANADDAEQLHLRTVLGYSTQRFYGFYARVEFEAGTRIGDDEALNIDDDLTFPPGPDGSRIAEGHAIIPDNEFEEFNEAYIGWRWVDNKCADAMLGKPCNGSTTVKAGRQTIIFNNHRWVGNIVWRQNHQSYDAIRIDNTSIPNLSVSYVYLDRVRRTFGEDSAFDQWDMNNSHLINIAYKFPFGTLTGYGYLLDFDDNEKTPFPEGVGAVGTPGIANFDSNTWGARFVGKYKIGEAFSLPWTALYELEWANQDPNEDAGPTLSDNDYYNIEGGFATSLAGRPVAVKVGREVLEGNGVNAVQTPLATFHAFNGWADKFVGAPGGSATPAGGIEDTNVTLIVDGLLGKSKLIARYHNFEADTTVGGIKDYGTEWNVQFTKPFAKNWLALAKYANFDDGGDGFSFDTEKYWLMLQYRFQ